MVARLMVFLEWMVGVPPELEEYYTEQVELQQEGNDMSYVSVLARGALQEGIERGLKQGLEEGREEGIDQGRLDILRKQLTRRFGELDQAALQKLDGASTAELERWAENILDAQTLEEVFTLH